MDNTYQELSLHDRRTIELTIWKDDGEPFYPSGASYEVKGTKKQTTIVPKGPASVNLNRVYTQVGLSVTASAAEYDVLWEIRKDGDIHYHCTKLLVNDTC